MEKESRFLKEILLYFFVAFIVMKVWRAFSGSTEQGGIWNFIQCFFVVIGFVLFLRFSRIINKEPAVIVLVLYSFYALCVSVLSIEDMKYASIFVLVKAVFPGMVAIVFYIYGLNSVKESSKIILKLAFYISSAILCYRLGTYMLTGGLRSSGAGAVADVYYILGLLPYVLSITKANRQLIPIAVTAFSLFLSQKRAGFIAFVGFVFIFYLMKGFIGKSNKSLIGKVIILFLLFTAGYYLMIYMDSHFNLNLFERLQRLETDGGSGRDIRWQDLSREIMGSSSLQLFFGHGANGVVNLFGSHAHNDFLEVFYNYGIISLVLYSTYYIVQLFNSIKMLREKYYYSSEFLGSIFISLFIAMFSYYVIDATYIICGCFTQSILLAEWKSHKNVLQEPMKTDAGSLLHADCKNNITSFC